jgi:hypothetical protein
VTTIEFIALAVILVGVFLVLSAGNKEILFKVIDNKRP